VKTIVMVAVAILGCAHAASAQVPAGRFSVSIGGGAQAASDLHDTFTFTEFQETGTVTADYPGKVGVLVDGGFAFRLRKQIRAGVAVTYAMSDGAANVSARVPHPLQLDRPRDVSGTTSKLDRRETGVHAQLQYVVPITRKLHLVLAGGPSYFTVEQQLVDAVQYDHVYPYDEATFRGAVTRRAKGSAVGFNAGADAVWTLTRRVGLGGNIRFARGSVDLEGSDGRTAGIDAGGVQGSVGLRLSLGK
jgi:hypothetical protein